MDVSAVETIHSGAWAPDAPVEASVLVPTYDRAGFLAGLMDALEMQTFSRSRFEIVIVDNGSTDATWDELQRIAATTMLRLSAACISPNRGPAAARNVAASLARGTILAFTDDDCLPSPGWLEGLVRAAASADLVQGSTLPEQGVDAGPWDRSVTVTRPSPLYETCNIAYRRSSFDSLGGFDDGLVPQQERLPFGEDAVLGARVNETGGRVAFASDAVVYHRVLPGSFRGWLRERRRLALFPALARRSPAVARALWGRLFLSRETAEFDLALAAVVATAVTRRPVILVAAVPWIWSRWRDARWRAGRNPLVRLAQLGVGDVIGFVSLVEGSIRHRRIVL